MVDGVSFNPFSGKVFTTEEINKLDTNQDGVVSKDELSANMSWLSETADEEGDVIIGEENTTPPSASTTAELTESGQKLYGAAQKNGVKDSASSSDELKEYLNTIQDEYIQQYMKDNPGMTAEEKSSFVTFVKSTGTEYVNEFVKNNSKAATFDTQSIAAELISKLDSAVVTRKETQANVDSKIASYKDNADSSFKNLAEYTDKADDDYVTSAEFKEMKNQTVSYLMGSMMNGNVDADFLKKFDVNYPNNKNYQTAMKAINDLQSEADPVKAQELLDQAEAALGKLVGTQNTDGTSKLNTAINTKQEADVAKAKTAQQEAYKTQLASINDKLLESMSNETTTSRSFLGRNRTKLAYTEADIQARSESLNKILDKFVSEYEGDGKNIETEYKAYVAKVEAENKAAMNQLENNKKDSYDSYQELKLLVDSAGTYTSAEEKAAIVNKSIDFVFNEMLQGKYDISLLAQIYPEYTTDENFVEAKSLMDGLEGSITRSEDIAKIKELLTTMMNNIGAEKIQDGVENKKATALTLSDEQRNALTSSVPGYADNASYSSGRYRDRNDALDDAQNNAKQTLESMREQIKSMYKAQLGADYDESKINQYIDEAIYTTINQFTDQRVDKSGKHYTTEDAGFVTSKSGRKSRGVYNVRQLVDTFLTNFQSISAADAAEKDPAKNPVSLDSIMKDTSLADDFQDNKTKTVGLNKSNAEAAVKTQIQEIAIQLKSKLRAQLGSDYDSAKIDEMINKATQNSLESYSAKKLLGKIHIYSVSTSDVANKFYDEFNKLYEEAAASK